MSKIEFHDYSEQIKDLIGTLAESTLREVAGELEAQVKRNTAVDTGQTKNSWKYTVQQTNEGYMAQVGSDYMNAVWEEFGTGEYALKGDGRKGGWAYKDAKGDWHYTLGKQPRRPFWKAYTANKNKYIKFIQSKFKGGLS